MKGILLNKGRLFFCRGLFFKGFPLFNAFAQGLPILFNRLKAAFKVCLSFFKATFQGLVQGYFPGVPSFSGAPILKGSRYR